jgi:hypothetical protein
VLHIDSSREGPGEIADEPLESRWLLPRIRAKDFEELFGLCP